MDEPPYTCKTSEIMNKLDTGEIPEMPVKEHAPDPLDAAAGSQLPAMCAMLAWSKAWILDGDVCRCRKCKRGINVERRNEAMIHAFDCPQSHLIAPWQDLRSRIPANR
jgi:hypothetical protein